MTRKKRIRFISQANTTECGVACVAMLMERGTLRKARKLIEFPNDGDFRTTHTEIRNALEPFGVTIGRKISCNDWKILRESVSVALVAVNHSIDSEDNIPKWHWLVYDNTGTPPRILDPNKKTVRKSHGNTRVAWFHHVRF